MNNLTFHRDKGSDFLLQFPLLLTIDFFKEKLCLCGGRKTNNTYQEKYVLFFRLLSQYPSLSPLQEVFYEEDITLGIKKLFLEKKYIQTKEDRIFVNSEYVKGKEDIQEKVL